MNPIIFGIDNPNVRALGELVESERRQEGFEQFINDSIYNGELDILAEEIEYDLEETLDRFEELKEVIVELGSKELAEKLDEVRSWIHTILKQLNSINVFELENEDTINELSETLMAAFEANTYFLLVEEKIREHIENETTLAEL